MMTSINICHTVTNGYQKDPLFLMVDELIRTSTRLRTVLSAATRDIGLTPTEVTVLTAVAAADKPPTMPQIGRSLGSPRQVIQRAANALISQGLIETVDNPGHLRSKLLVATRRGVELKAEIDARARSSAEGLTRSLDDRRCEKLTADLRKLRREVETFVRQSEREK